YEHAERATPSLRLEVVGNDRIGEGQDARFPSAEDQPGNKQAKETASESTPDCAQAPDDDAARKQVDPVLPVRPIAHGKAESGIQKRERQPLKQPNLGIRELQVLFDRLNEKADRDAIQDRENIGDRDDRQRIPRLTAAGPTGRRRCPALAHKLCSGVLRPGLGALPPIRSTAARGKDSQKSNPRRSPT